MPAPDQPFFIFPEEIDTSWHGDALCRDYSDPDVWFPDSEKLSNPKVQLAQSICAYCRVKSLCLKQGLDNDRAQGIDYGGLGIWGGLTTRQRGRLTDKQLELIEQGWHPDLERLPNPKVVKIKRSTHATNIYHPYRMPRQTICGHPLAAIQLSFADSKPWVIETPSVSCKACQRERGAA